MSKPCASRSVANARQMLTCLAFGLVAPAALAAGDGRAASPAGVSTGACEVLASGQLGSNEYIASYQGACKDGQANGQGRAEWRLRYAPNAAPVVWEGRFHQGVYLAESAVKGARRIDRTRVLLDLGTFQSAGQSGRMWVESRVDGKLPASACQPISVRLLAPGELTDDNVAKQWLQAGFQRWQQVCGGEAATKLKGRNVQLSIHQGSEIAPDGYGNMPATVVTTYGPFDAGSYQPTQYTNKAAQAVVQQQQQAAQATEQAQTHQRLKAFATEVGAKRYVDLRELEQNPFRYGEQVLLVAVNVVSVESPVQAIVQPARRTRYEYSRALVNGVQVAQWGSESRLLAVRSMGRSKEPGSKGVLSLAVVESRSCKEINCADYTYVTGNRWLRDEEL